MAKSKGRVGMVSLRSQLLNPITKLWQKRSVLTGMFMDTKTVGGPFKGVRKEKRGRLPPRA